MGWSEEAVLNGNGNTRIKTIINKQEETKICIKAKTTKSYRNFKNRKDKNDENSTSSI